MNVVFVINYSTDLIRPVRIQPSVDAFKNYADEVLVASGWGRVWTNGNSYLHIFYHIT